MSDIQILPAPTDQELFDTLVGESVPHPNIQYNAIIRTLTIKDFTFELIVETAAPKELAYDDNIIVIRLKGWPAGLDAPHLKCSLGINAEQIAIPSQSRPGDVIWYFYHIPHPLVADKQLELRVCDPHGRYLSEENLTNLNVGPHPVLGLLNQAIENQLQGNFSDKFLVVDVSNPYTSVGATDPYRLLVAVQKYHNSRGSHFALVKLVGVSSPYSYIRATFDGQSSVHHWAQVAGQHYTCILPFPQPEVIPGVLTVEVVCGPNDHGSIPGCPPNTTMIMTEIVISKSYS